MHRLMVDSAALAMSAPTLPKEALNHLKVLRPKNDEPIELFDGRGQTRVFRYNEPSRTLTDPGELQTFAKPQPSLTLFACVTKGSRWDWTIEKATELGVTRIVPVISEHTIVRMTAGEREAKRARWARIAADAARQSDAVWLPEILAPVTFAESLPLVRKTNCFVGALANPPARPLAAAVQAALATPANEAPRELAVYVGPEGDFTSAELDTLLQLAIPTSFGPTVLRAETAAIFALSVVAALASRA